MGETRMDLNDIPEGDYIDMELAYAQVSGKALGSQEEGVLGGKIRGRLEGFLGETWVTWKRSEGGLRVTWKRSGGEVEVEYVETGVEYVETGVDWGDRGSRSDAKPCY